MSSKYYHIFSSYSELNKCISLLFPLFSPSLPNPGLAFYSPTKSRARKHLSSLICMIVATNIGSSSVSILVIVWQHYFYVFHIVLHKY